MASHRQSSKVERLSSQGLDLDSSADRRTLSILLAVTMAGPAPTSGTPLHSPRQVLAGALIGSHGYSSPLITTVSLCYNLQLLVGPRTLQAGVTISAGQSLRFPRLWQTSDSVHTPAEIHLQRNEETDG